MPSSIRSVAGAGLLIITTVVSAGCTGASPSAVVPQRTTATMTPASALAQATFAVHIPGSGTTAAASRLKRVPSYVSQRTAKFVTTLLAASAGLPSPNTAVTTSVSPGQAPCASGTEDDGYTCTITLGLPPGSDQLELQAEDSMGNVISQQIASLPIAQGVANSIATSPAFDVTMDLVPAGISGLVLGSQPVFDNGTVSVPESCSELVLGNVQDETGLLVSTTSGLPSVTVTSNSALVTISNVDIDDGSVTFDAKTGGATGLASISLLETPASANDGIGTTATTTLNIQVVSSGGCM